MVTAGVIHYEQNTTAPREAEKMFLGLTTRENAAAVCSHVDTNESAIVKES